jgi:hypothetical protein
VLIAAFVLEGIGILIMLASGVVWLSRRMRKYGNPRGRNALIEGFIVGQIFFDLGIMFHLGYLTASI